MSTVVPQKLPGNTIPATRTKLRNACFTINNPKMDRNDLMSSLFQTELVSYAVVGSEIGESGTPHFQGYVEFKHQVDFSLVRTMLHNGHIEARKGTAGQASLYCQKEGEWGEMGKISAQGDRSDIHAITDMVVEGKSTYEIASTYPAQFVRYHKGLLALRAALIQRRAAVPEVNVYHGATGTGKSYRAREWLPNAYVWHPQQGTWFDGYQGETEVILEEFRGQIPFGMLLSLLDRYCCKVQYKGGIVEFAAVKIAITSPVSPDKWYQCLEDGDRLDQLTRRINNNYLVVGATTTT